MINRLIGGAIGEGLADNVQEAYSFLVSNYVEGDEIYLIGFSRGAYTARSIGGLISDIGLLTRQGLDYFYAIYADWESTGTKGWQSELAKADPGFKITADSSDKTAWLTSYYAELKRRGYVLPQKVTINAIGVWETVGALGIPTSPWLRRLGLPYHFRKYAFFDTQIGRAHV